MERNKYSVVSFLIFQRLTKEIQRGQNHRKTGNGPKKLFLRLFRIFRFNFFVVKYARKGYFLSNPKTPGKFLRINYCNVRWSDLIVRNREIEYYAHMIV
jgi:hypothetical protein